MLTPIIGDKRMIGIAKLKTNFKISMMMCHYDDYVIHGYHDACD